VTGSLGSDDEQFDPATDSARATLWLMPDLATNVPYYGDNLDILGRDLPDAAVDQVYLDPPFNSNRDDDVIFRDESGNATGAQLLAFEDEPEEFG
jgi:16S rRNA G966 N2-methylase RsmD